MIWHGLNFEHFKNLENLKDLRDWRNLKNFENWLVALGATNTSNLGLDYFESRLILVYETYLIPFEQKKFLQFFGQKFVNFGHSGIVRILLRCGSCRAKRVSNTSQGDLLRWVKQYFSSFSYSRFGHYFCWIRVLRGHFLKIRMCNSEIKVWAHFYKNLVVFLKCHCLPQANLFHTNDFINVWTIKGS